MTNFKHSQEWSQNLKKKHVRKEEKIFFEKFSSLNQLIQNFEHLLKNVIKYFGSKQNGEAL